MFWFTFPYRPDEETAALVATENLEENETDRKPKTPPKTRCNSVQVMAKSILLIEDSPSVLRVTSRFLLMNGHTVVTAPNGCAGLEILKETYATEQQFDMVLTDMQMPGNLFVIIF
jgi:PleD family two-component response regulator